MDRGGCIDSFVCARWKNVRERVESLDFSPQILGRKSAQFNSHSLTGELLNCVRFWLKKRGFLPWIVWKHVAGKRNDSLFTQTCSLKGGKEFKRKVGGCPGKR